MIGKEYEIDFGSEEKNEAFKEAIKHGYDGHDHGIPVNNLNKLADNIGDMYGYYKSLLPVKKGCARRLPYWTRERWLV